MKNTDEQIMRWIPTAEELPPPFRVVLILYPRLYADMKANRQSTFVCRLERSFGLYDGEGEWLNMYPKAEDLTHNKPQYWMPLPKYDYEEYITDKQRGRQKPKKKQE